MPKRGIHPLTRAMTVVLRNGASFRVNTVSNRAYPMRLQVDPSNHPVWTGEKAGLSLEDERIAKIMSRYQGFLGPQGTGTPQDQ